MLNFYADKYSLDLPYHSVWLSVEKVRGELLGHYEGLFDKLRWYVKVVKVTNLGSVLKLEFDP